jgi:hypothetical protein
MKMHALEASAILAKKDCHRDFGHDYKNATRGQKNRKGVLESRAGAHRLEYGKKRRKAVLESRAGTHRLEKKVVLESRAGTHRESELESRAGARRKRRKLLTL